jgi:hypothetical protein
MPRLSLDSLWPLLLLLPAAYLLILALIYFSQSRLLYQPGFPSRALTASPAELGLRFESVYFEAEDGVRLHGWFLPAPENGLTLLFFHGNAGNISHRLDSLRQFHDLGVNTFIFDYRGYGESEGSPGENGSYLDAAAAWRYLTRERGVAAQDILLFGRSLGGAIATWLAVERPSAGLIIESTFTSIPDLAAELYPWLPVRPLARIHYPTLARIGLVRSPLLVVHSREDELIPFAHGRRLFEKAANPKRFLEISGDHNGGTMISGAGYTDGLRAFLAALPASRDRRVRPRDATSEYWYKPQ